MLHQEATTARNARSTFRFTTTLALSALMWALLALPAHAQLANQKELRNASGHAWKGAEMAFPDAEGTPRQAILLRADGSQGDVIHYVDHDGTAVVDGDILIHVDAGYAAFDRRVLETRGGRAGQRGAQKSAGRTADHKQWRGGLVPYVIDGGVGSTVLDWISDAMDEWESETQIRFVPRTTETDYLYFTANSHCSSWIGRQGGRQTININGCWKMGNAIHEIGHAVGLYHEHTRADRYSHVDIIWDNIASSSYNFEQYTHADGLDLGDYDYGSIMHYGCWAFTPDNITLNTSTMSIRPNNTNRCYSNYDTFYTGQRNALSDGDIEGIDMLYPDVRMLAMNSAGNDQGTVLYEVDETDASTDQINALFGSERCVTDMDFLPSSPLLYAVGCDDPGAGSTLFRIEWIMGLTFPSTPIRNIDGSTRQVTSLAADPISWELYAIDRGGKGWGRTLLTVHPITGIVTEIADLWGDHTEASAIAFREDGKLFAMDNSNNGGRGEALFTIDIATGQTREIGTLSGDRSGADTLRFGANGTLYGSRRNNSERHNSVLFLIDTDHATTYDIEFFFGDRTQATSMAIFGTESAGPGYKIRAMNSAGNAQGTVLYEIDADDADTTDIGTLSGFERCITDLDYYPNSPFLVAIGCDSAGSGSTLFQINEDLLLPGMPPATIHDGGSVREMTSIAIDPSDQRVYAIDRSGKGWGNTLVELDRFSGRVTEIGDLSGDQSAASSIAFDPDGDVLYGMNNVNNQGSGDVLFKINLNTAVTTNIGTLTGSRTRATTIRFAPDGTLYGTRGNNSDSNSSVLFLIDPEDATTRDVGFLHGDRKHATSMAIRKE